MTGASCKDQDVDLPAAPPLERGASRGKWSGGPHGTSAMDDTTTVAYTLDAEKNQVIGEIARACGWKP